MNLNSDPKLPSILLDQAVWSELPQVFIKERRISVEQIQERQHQIAAANQLFQLEHPLRNQTKILQAVHTKRHRTAALALRIGMYALPAVALLLVLNFAISSNFDAIKTTSAPPILSDLEAGIRSKGLGPQLFIYKVNPAMDSAELVQPDQSLQTADLLQLRFNPGEFSHCAIFSIDGNGTISLHYPTDPQRLAVVDKRAIQTTPYSYLLDDAPDFENFFIVARMEAFTMSDILPYIEASLRNPHSNPSSLALPESYTVRNIYLRKRRQ